jgi:hypothetical protein
MNLSIVERLAASSIARSAPASSSRERRSSPCKLATSAETGSADASGSIGTPSDAGVDVGVDVDVGARLSWERGGGGEPGEYEVWTGERAGEVAVDVDDDASAGAGGVDLARA